MSVRVCRPKLLKKNLCQSLVSGVPHFFFRTAPLMRSRVYETVERPRPSVCYVDRQQQRRAAGLLLSAGACSRYRSITGTWRKRLAANAGSVVLRAEGRGSTKTCCMTRSHGCIPPCCLVLTATKGRR